jgi:molecular chaperone HscC
VATDVAPFTLGVATTARLGTQVITGLFAPIIERGTTIPASRAKVFSPAADGQTVVNIEVFQGEHSECSKNEPLGSYEVKGLAPLKSHENALEFRFTYDLNGILEIEITRLSSGTRESCVVQNRLGSLTQKEIETAREAMKKWKIHPRDLLPNTTAMERADAVYVTLRGEVRERLGEGIARFKAALESQDPEVIASARGELNALSRAVR